MGWVTLDDGQHVFIGSGGTIYPGGPGGRPASYQKHLALKPGTKTADTVAKAKAAPTAPKKGTALRSKLAAKISEHKRAALAQEHPEEHARPGDLAMMHTSKIAFDAPRFQYKLDTTGEHGVSQELKDVKKWNPESAGVLSVWKDPANGQTYVVNGHHRLDLAKKLGVDKVAVRFLDAPDAKTAKMKGAVVNIAEGRGTPLDAATIFREAGNAHEFIKAAGIPMSEATARQGAGIAGLSDHLFQKVVNREIPFERAAIIGGAGLSEAQQKTVHEQAVKRRATNGTVRELIENAREAPTLTVGHKTLFGDDQEEISLAFHRAKAADNVSRALSSDEKLFKLVSKSKSAEALAERGRSHIDVEKTGEVSQEAAAVLGVFHTLKKSAGPVSRELNRAAERLHAGENESQVLREARHNISGHVKNMLQGGAAAFAA